MFATLNKLHCLYNFKECQQVFYLKILIFIGKNFFFILKKQFFFF